MRVALRTLSVLGRCCWAVFAVQLVVGFFVEFPRVWGWLLIAAAIGCKTAGWLLLRSADVPPALEVGPPVAGRWSALNSPTDRVPSHGVREYGQAYAIDVVAEPEEGARPSFGWWPLCRGNGDFPAFGAPVFAVADATVVAAVDHRRDHLSRTSYPALLYLFAEGFLRDASGPGRVVGNHVVLDLGGGTYALYAHLRRGSLTVRPGERVRAGQRMAQCGNSGNSSEPHVHFQLMDTPDLRTARGVPFTWRGIGVPGNGEDFTAVVGGAVPGGHSQATPSPSRSRPGR
jgi:murein DD-endopeptidase MepM/ murein hydrolase activator NlpD